MKKIFLFAYLSIFLFSCSSEENQNPVTEQESSNFLTYHFNDEILRIEFTEENDELVLKEGNELNLLNTIYEENENLIQHYVSDNEIYLFSDDQGLNSFLEAQGTPLKASSQTARFNFDQNNLRMFFDCCYDSRKEILWNFVSPPCFSNTTTEERLRDFTNPAWRIRGAGPAVAGCGFNPNPSIGIPNDKMNSVFVRGIFARFYENINYGGRSITLDARFTTGIAGFRKLRQVRNGLFGRNWSNRISSVRLSR